VSSIMEQITFPWMLTTLPFEQSSSRWFEISSC
jgi:hypothetical protein